MDSFLPIPQDPTSYRLPISLLTVEDITYKILSASDRVVAGRLYNLKIAATETDPASCTVMSYEVWDKAGAPADNQYTLQSAKEQFNEKC